MLFTSRNHAIGMAHYQMAGGHKGLLGLTGAYLVAAGAILGLMFYNAERAMWPRMVLLAVTLFFGVESFAVVVLGAVRVAGCIRTDQATNMLESHRQMPVSAARAIVSYLFGSTIQILFLMGMTILLLFGLMGVSGMGMQEMVLSQVVLVAFALFIWSFAAMGAFMSRQAMPIIVLLFVFGTCGSMMLRGWGILPGFSVLAAPFLGQTIFDFARPGAGGGGLMVAYPVALCSQAAFAVLFFIGACRRYRGTYLTTFNAPMGLALVACWSALSAIAIWLWPQLGNRFSRDLEQPAPTLQVVASLCVAGVLMLVPLHALAAWEVRHTVRNGLRLAVVAGAVVAGSILLLGYPMTPGMMLLPVLVLAAHGVTAYAALKFTARFTPMSMLITMLMLLVVLWFLPLVGEAIRWYWISNPYNVAAHRFSVISTLSPAGILLAAWQPNAADAAPADAGPMLWVGLAFQWGVAALMWQLVRRQARLAAARATGVPPQSSPSSYATDRVQA